MYIGKLWERMGGDRVMPETGPHMACSLSSGDVILSEFTAKHKTSTLWSGEL
jgi:hypothetical protein